MGKKDTATEIDHLKTALRVRLLETRRLLSAADRTLKSRRIWERCLALPFFRRPSLVCSYVGYGEEVQTGEGLQGLLNSGCRIAVPTQKDGRAVPSFAEIHAWEDLSPNALGILEPSAEVLRPVPTGQIPLFLVPGVGFDESGARLGYGLGFYDRALEPSSPDALRVGLAFEVQVVSRIPVDDHDYPMDMIVTENRVIEASVHSRPQEEVC